MLIFVLICNLLIGLGCLFVAWTLWQIRGQLGAAADGMDETEKAIHETLFPAPGYIMIGQISIRNLRNNPPNFDLKLQQIQRAIGVVNLLRSIWLGRIAKQRK
jgi:hypothetical protein